MEVRVFVEGPIDANNYLVIDDRTRDAILIDCSSDRNEFIQAVKDLNVNLKYIFLTHGHFDHLLGVDKFKSIFGAEVFIAESDLSQVKLVPHMMQMFAGMQPVNVEPITNFVNDGDEFVFGDTKIKAIATPGHTKGGMCYLVEDKLFSGDTLFKLSVGRCDLFEGDIKALVSSLQHKVFELSDNVAVYPGHGESSTIGFEKKYNEILNV